MSEANPIGRTDDADAVESSRRTSADADHGSPFGEQGAEAWSADADADPDDLLSSSGADHDAGFGPRSTADQVDIDAQEADEIAARLSSER
jgi:hypothetical protein